MKIRLRNVDKIFAANSMKQLTIILSLLISAVLVFISCKKWVDPAPTTDPRLTTHYCNDQNAVNYNWGFPGVPDNTICFYPTDLFKGSYNFTDSVRITASNYFTYARSGILNIYAISQTKILVIGFCGGDTLRLTAVGYTAYVDSILGDSTTIGRGQKLCRIQDTASGSITNSRVDTLLHITFDVISDTGRTTHTAIAKKI